MARWWMLLVVLVILWTAWKISAPTLQRQDYVEIWPLRWKVENPSTLTYNDLGYMGRTGNQLFELAATISLARRERCGLLFPPSIRKLKLWQWFDLRSWPISDLELVPHAYLEETGNLDRLSVPPTGRLYSLSGYRQSHLYFCDINDELTNIFRLRSSPPKTRIDYIALHVRKTDFQTSRLRQELKMQLECSRAYYEGALRYLKSRYGTMPVFIVTDDARWTEENFRDLGITCSSRDPLEDFLLIKNATHCVVANSTFSYWAALLNSRKATVIAPSRWWHEHGLPNRLFGFGEQDICPPHWILLDPETGRLDHCPTGQGQNGWMRSVFSRNLFRTFTP